MMLFAFTKEWRISIFLETIFIHEFSALIGWFTASLANHISPFPVKPIRIRDLNQRAELGQKA